MTFKTILQYKDILLVINYSETNIHIQDSFKITDKKVMQLVLNDIVNKAAKNNIVYKRTINSWINEWVSHNYLYNKNIEVERTASVDLNEDEKPIRKIGYWFISKFLY